MALEKGGFYDFVSDGDWDTFAYYGATQQGHTILGGGYYALSGHDVPSWVETEEQMAEYEAFWMDEAPYMITSTTYNWSGHKDIGG